MLLRAESLDINSALLSRGRRGGVPVWGSQGRPGTLPSGVRTGRERGVRDPLAHPVRLTRSQPANGSHQGTPVTRSRCHKMMNSKGDGGPARTRTWDQGIMSNRIPSLLLLKAEEA